MQVARVNSDEITKISTSDLGTALQGMVAGVNVQASSGELEPNPTSRFVV